MNEAERGLDERRREFRFIGELCELVLSHEESLERVLQDTVRLIPFAFSRPESVSARLLLEDANYDSKVFHESPDPKRFDIPGSISLTLEIHLGASEDRNRLLTAERELFLESLASLIGQLVNHWSEINEQRKSHQLLSGVFKAISEAVFVIKLPERTILGCNPAVEQIFGYECDELIGRNTLLIHLGAIEYAEWDAISLPSLLKSGSYHGRYQMRRKDGTVIRTEHSVRLLGKADGSPALAVSVVRDVTEQERLYRRVNEIAASERESIRRDLHDSVFQSLSGIGFLAHEIQENLRENPEEAARDAERIRKLIDQAVEQSRYIRKGLLPLTDEPGVLAESLRDLASYIQDVYRVNCHFSLRRGVRITNSEVSTQLSLIAREAAINAAKHAHATEITLSLSERGDSVFLEIRDDGSGLSEAIEEATGTGLGNMHDRAQLIGAELEIRSRPGQGTAIVCRWDRTQRS